MKQEKNFEITSDYSQKQFTLWFIRLDLGKLPNGEYTKQRIFESNSISEIRDFLELFKEFNILNNGKL